MFRHAYHPRTQAGATVVEFAIAMVAFLMLVFGILETARAMYLFNILQDVTRRAAALASVTDFKDAAALDNVRQTALFADAAGQLVLGAPITQAHIRIDYLAVTRDAGGDFVQSEIAGINLPASSARNKSNCILNPYGANCIRLVRARICDPGNRDACAAVAYQPIFPLVSLAVNLPVASTVVRAESLGFIPGTAP